MTDFTWPCDLRIAHGPHHYAYCVRPDGHSPSDECPGVQAHPNTMIGRNQ